MKSVKKERYIVNGVFFPSYEDVVSYNEANRFRVVSTQTVRPGVYLVSVASI